jgi:hypothetical protein
LSSRPDMNRWKALPKPMPLSQKRTWGLR